MHFAEIMKLAATKYPKDNLHMERLYTRIFSNLLAAGFIFLLFLTVSVSAYMFLLWSSRCLTRFTYVSTHAHSFYFSSLRILQ